MKIGSNIRRKRELRHLIGALVFSFLIALFGYYYLGALVGLLFLIGYFGGFVFWVFIRTSPTWSSIRTPYFVALTAFILHKIEENRMKFFEILGEKITGIPMPEVSPLLVFGLLFIPIGAWLLIPSLLKRSHPLGCFLAWTYYASFSLVESAHFIFPLLTDEPYGYFPGMVSALILVPIGFWGMWKLSRT